MYSAHHKNLIVNGRNLEYKGVFKADELFATINRALEAKHYHKNEKRTEELVTETGKRTYVELRPDKHLSSYIEFIMKIKITLDNVTDIVEEVKGVKQKFQQGDVTIVFDSWVVTDYEHRWTMKPVIYFLKGIINKLIFTFPIEAGAPGELAGDTSYIYSRIKKLLDSYKYSSREIVQEKDVRLAVEEDVKKSMST
ncbi:TPA: hypothetical protein HA278_07250 [Candidatus Woesearchaeota archaeon]|jgi:hypothetical protein|nr:hypothetical protein [archaeon]HIJ11829.1 hypothetical protein [Candidatus Woesearchaeota archaeon]